MVSQLQVQQSPWPARFFTHIHSSLRRREFREREYVPSFRVKLKASRHGGVLTLPFAFAIILGVT